MSRSETRTATETSRKPRRRKWTLRALTAVIMAGGTVASLAGPAQAVDESVCQKVFGANVLDIDLVVYNTTHVDFGELPHSFTGGGAPQGDAVVCWSRERRVFIAGTLFFDNPKSRQYEAELLFRMYDEPGGPGNPVEYYSFRLGGGPGRVTSREIQLLTPEGPPIFEIEVNLRIWTSPSQYVDVGTGGVADDLFPDDPGLGQ